MKLIVAIIAILGLTGCGSGQSDSSNVRFEQNPPFNLANGYYQDWVAGVKEGGSGTNIHLTFQSMDPDVALTDLYFKGYVLPVTRKMTSAIAYTASYTNETKRPDVIMDSDPAREAANRPPKNSPFSLKDNQAVLSYMYNGKLYYYKIATLERKEMLAYPSSNPRGDN